MESLDTRHAEAREDLKFIKLRLCKVKSDFAQRDDEIHIGLKESRGHADDLTSEGATVPFGTSCGSVIFAQATIPALSQ